MKINSITQIFKGEYNQNNRRIVRQKMSCDSFERTSRNEIISSETLCKRLVEEGFKKKYASALNEFFIDNNLNVLDVRLSDSILNIYKQNKSKEDLYEILGYGLSEKCVKKEDRLKFFSNVEKFYSNKNLDSKNAAEIAINLALESFETDITNEDIELVSALMSRKINIDEAIEIMYSVNCRNEKTGEIEKNQEVLNNFLMFYGKDYRYSASNALKLANIIDSCKQKEGEGKFELELIDELTFEKINGAYVEKDEIVKAIEFSSELKPRQKNEFDDIIHEYYYDSNYYLKHDMNSCIEMMKLKVDGYNNKDILLYLNLLGNKLTFNLIDKNPCITSEMAADVVRKYPIRNDKAYISLSGDLVAICKGKVLSLLLQRQVSLGDIAKIYYEEKNSDNSFSDIRKIIIERYDKK